MLAIKVYGTGLGIVPGVLSFVPLIGLIVLLVVNGKATGLLKQNGIKVGLLVREYCGNLSSEQLRELERRIRLNLNSTRNVAARLR